MFTFTNCQSKDYLAKVVKKYIATIAVYKY